MNKHQYAVPAGIGYAVSSSGDAAGLPRETQIVEEMGLLGNAADELFAVVQQLEARLSSVLQPASPVGTDGPLESYRVPLADGLRSDRRRIQGYTSMLSDILQRLEL